MASRKTTPTVDTSKLVALFEKLVTFEPIEDSPVSVAEMNDEMGYNTFGDFGYLADADLIEFETGKVWLKVTDVTAENAVQIAQEALSDFVPTTMEAPVRASKPKPSKAEYAARTKYNADVAASQEPGSQHLHPQEDARPAETPVIAENGETVTIPVDFDDPSKGRRELDAAKGEKLLSEDVFTVKDKVDTTSFSLAANAPLIAEAVRENMAKLRESATSKGLDQFKDAETGDMVYESAIEKNGLKLDEPETVPPVPAGVTPNFWDLAHTAITQSARDYWSKVVQTEQEEYSDNNGQPAPF